MIPRSIVSFEDGETLTPTKLNKGFEKLYSDMADVTRKKYNHFSIQLDFGGLDDTHTDKDKQYYIPNIPLFAGAYGSHELDFEIISAELVLYEATGNVTTVSLGFTGAGNWNTLSVAPAGATTRSKDIKNQAALHLNGSYFTVTVAASATPWILDRCYAVIHCRASMTGNPVVELEDAPRFAAGESVDASKVNTGFTTFENYLAGHYENKPRISVYTWRPLAVAPASSDIDFRIPDSARSIFQLDVYQTGDTGNNVTATILDDTGATVATATAVGATGTLTTGTAQPIATQDENDFDDPADDYKLRISRTGAAIVPFVYVIITHL